VFRDGHDKQLTTSERSSVPEIFLLLCTASTALPPILPTSSLRPAKILAVEFHSLTSSFWDPPSLVPNDFTSYPFETDLDDPYGPHGAYAPTSSTSTQSQAALQGLEHPCNGMKKYMESGGFFFAEDGTWDISSRMGESNWVQAGKRAQQSPLETYDERFVWNETLLKPLLDFRLGLAPPVRAVLDEQNLLIPIIQGFCGSLPISTGMRTSTGKQEVAAFGMISRLGWKRAGARFRTRGIDDDGQVANFVETETILATERVTMSYVQVRGSVPLFWEQPTTGLQTMQQRVQLTRVSCVVQIGSHLY
jgi:hypothetical protein